MGSWGTDTPPSLAQLGIVTPMILPRGGRLLGRFRARALPANADRPLPEAVDAVDVYGECGWASKKPRLREVFSSGRGTPPPPERYWTPIGKPN